jgi:hypothetical protein
MRAIAFAVIMAGCLAAPVHADSFDNDFYSLLFVICGVGFILCIIGGW